MDVNQEPAPDTEPAAQPAHGIDRAPNLRTQVAALARLLARQAAREHLRRSSHPDMEDSADET